MSKHKKHKNITQNSELNIDDPNFVEEEFEDTDDTIEEDITEEVIEPIVETVHVEVQSDITPVVCVEESIVSDKYYRVGTGWKNGTCINNSGSYVVRDQAINAANTATKNTGVVHNVYDPTGKIIFTAKTKLTLFAKKKRGARYVNRNIK